MNFLSKCSDFGIPEAIPAIILDGANDESIAKNIPKKPNRCMRAKSETVNIACQKHRNKTNHFTADALADDDNGV